MTFLKITGEGTLGDLQMTGYGEDGYEDCQIMANKLNVGGGSLKPTYIWWDTLEWEDEDGTIYPAIKGWYDDEESECYDSVPLAPGEGIWLKSPSIDIKAVSAGQVAVEDIPVTLIKGFQLCSNPMPCTLKLGKAYMSGYGDGYEDCQIMANKLNVGGGSLKPTYLWWDTPEWEDDDGTVYDACYGWYDDEESECYNDSVEMKPGEALWLKSPTDTYLLHWTSPLAPAVD